MTITSNIHLGIVGWSNATYAIGARRSNVGNAYQVTSPGTSTAPPTGTGTGINNGGTAVWKYLSAVDFTTLQAQANSLASNPGQPVLNLLWNDSTVVATVGTAILTLTGHTTSNVNTITYRPAPGESFQAVYQAAPTTAYAYNAANGVAFQLPASGTGGINYFQINDSWVIFDGIQFKDPNATSGSTIIGGTGTHVSISHCIIDGFGQSGATPIGIDGNNLTITNSLLIARNTTASGEMVKTSAGTGFIIVNNTFVHATLTTGQRAVSSGNNVTNATMVSKNNIFVNYDIPYGAASGTPWVSNNCAYSAASFSASNAGTNTGGSVFGITTANTFANFPTDFHVKTGSTCINAGATDSTDIPAADDAFGSSRPQGTNWDIGAHELLAAPTTVIRDFVMTLMVLKTVPGSAVQLPNPWSSDFSSDFGGGSVSAFTTDPAFGIEWRQSTGQSHAAQAEWANSFIAPPHPIAVQGEISAEILQSFPSLVDPFSSELSSEFGIGSYNANPPAIGIEWRAGTPSATRDAAVGIEWGTARQRDIAAAEEVLQSAPTLLSPWSQQFTPQFGIGPFSIYPIFALEWSGSAVSVTVPIALETVTSVQRSVTVPVEPKLGVQRDVVTGEEFSGSAQFVANMAAGVEWKQSFATNYTAPVAWGVPAISTDVTVSAEWRSGIVADGAASSEWRGSLRLDSAAAVSWQQPVVVNAISPVEAAGSVLRDASIPGAAMANLRQDSITPVTTDGTLRTIGGSIMAVEFLQSFPSLPYPFSQELSGEFGIGSYNVDPAAFGVEWTAPVVSLSVAAPLTWGASVARDSGAGAETSTGVSGGATAPLAANTGVAANATDPLEFGHLTVNLIAESTMPLEFGRIVFVDVRPSIEDRRRRPTIGSKLDPDQWEEDHEP